MRGEADSLSTHYLVNCCISLSPVTHQYVNDYRGFLPGDNPTYMHVVDQDESSPSDYNPPLLRTRSNGTMELSNPLYSSASYSRIRSDTSCGTLHNLLYGPRGHASSTDSKTSAEHLYESVQHETQQLLVQDGHTT